MPDQQTNHVTIDDLRRKVSWLFYGTRTYSGLGSTDKDIVDEIIQDGYEHFLHPPILPNETESHEWNFLRPYLTLNLESSKGDYSLPPNFGGFEGDLFYGASANRRYPLQKTFAERILLWRQRDTVSFEHYPTHYAVVESNQDPNSPATAKVMIWPTPDSDYTVTGRYYIFTPPLNDANPYPPCDPFHNQTLTEAVLAKAEERLEDAQTLHAGLFIERLRSSVSHDRNKFASDYLGVDQDKSDFMLQDHDIMEEGNYVSYNGYTPGV